METGSKDYSRILSRYQKSLEELTFNSKPLIDDLTRTAGANNVIADQIVELIKKHIMKVRTEWKLPALYLMDSILKNLKGIYLEHISGVIVGVFCHCFEKLTGPDSRKLLYKLRTTWPPFLSKRKLASIDRHVHSLDPNWPVVAVDPDPMRPSIFVNPKFIEKEKNTSSSAPSSPATSDKTSRSNSPMHSELSAEDEHVVRSKGNTKPSRSPPPLTAAAEKRRKIDHIEELLRSRREKEMERTGNKTSTETGSTEELNRLTTPSTSPQATPTASVLSNTTPTLCVVSQATPTTDIAPHGTGSSGDTSMEAEEGVYQSNKVVAADSSEDQHVHSSEQTTSERPIRQSQLVLDDIPPQLLKVHHENMVKKIERQIAAGNVDAEQREILKRQLDQLYELQLLKDQCGDQKSIGGPVPPMSTTPPTFATPSVTPSVTPSATPSVTPMETVGPMRYRQRQIMYPRPRPFHKPRPSKQPYPLQPRLTPRLLNHTPLHRPSPRPHPPPGGLHPRSTGPWSTNLPVDKAGFGPDCGNHDDSASRTEATASVPVNPETLYSKLLSAGILQETATIFKIPTLSFTSATLKQRYSAVIQRLHQGEPCSSCGLRFHAGENELYRRHLNWHYRTNITRKEGRIPSNRNWFIHPDDWQKFEDRDSREVSLEQSGERDSPASFSLLVEASQDVDSSQSTCPVEPGEDQEVCSVCQEQLEQFWEEEEEVWLYRNTKRVNGRLCHISCDEDS